MDDIGINISFAFTSTSAHLPFAGSRGLSCAFPCRRACERKTQPASRSCTLPTSDSSLVQQVSPPSRSSRLDTRARRSQAGDSAASSARLKALAGIDVLLFDERAELHRLSNQDARPAEGPLETPSRRPMTLVEKLWAPLEVAKNATSTPRQSRTAAGDLPIREMSDDIRTRLVVRNLHRHGGPGHLRRVRREGQRLAEGRRRQHSPPGR